ncbi:MAG: hypothetical protein M3462_04330, partial [Chloroflexota bacterium]|nr:hypothetical protein [Chloroflexota bacterium]
MSSSGCGCDEFRWRRMLSRRAMVGGGAGLAAGMALGPLGRFGALAQDASPAASPAASGRTLLDNAGPVGASYLSPLVEIYGDVEIGERSFVASNTILYAGDGRL